MVRWVILFLFGATTLASCWFFAPVVRAPGAAPGTVTALEAPERVFHLSREDVVSVVVSAHDGRYLDLLRRYDGTWQTVFGEPLPKSWGDELLEKIIDLEVGHVTAGWNEDRYRSDGMALSVSLRGTEGPSQSIWFGSLEPSSGAPSGAIEQRWQAVRIGPEKEAPSHALPRAVSSEILLWVAPYLSDPSKAGG